MMPSYVLNAFLKSPWAILPERLVVLEEIVMRHVSGEKLDTETVQARIHGASRPADRRVSQVAILPLFGTIFPRANMMTQVSGATSADIFGAKFQTLLNDPAIGAIVLDVNSPGGQTGGIQEVSDQIYSARGQKPVVAVANHLMASAAYWIGTAADQVVVTPSAEVGSIGVFSVHEDMSAALMQKGVKVSIISAGKYKAEFNPWEPLTSEARAALQQDVNDVYDAFVETVARNRGVNPAAVRTDFGEGRIVTAKKAVQAGMADRIATLDTVVNELVGQLNPDIQPGKSSSNFPLEPESSAPEMTENERQAQSLRERVNQILKKEK